MLAQPSIGLGPDRIPSHRRDRHSQSYHGFADRTRQTLGHNLLTGLVDWWPLCEPMTSSGVRSGLHANFTLLGGGCSATGAGNGGTLASQFSNAANNKVFRGSSGVLQFGAAVSISLAAWVNLNSSFPGCALISKDDASSNREFNINITATGAARMQIGNGSTIVGGGNVQTGTGVVTSGSWFFIVGVYDQATPTLSIYVNAAATSNTPTTVGGSSAADFVVGSDCRAAANQSVDGFLQRCGYWKRALTAGEVTYLYNGGFGRDYPFI